MPLLAPGIAGLGLPELLIIAFVVVLIFGASRLADLGGSLGKGIREFRKATREEDDAPSTSASSLSTDPDLTAAPSASETAFCGECGARNARNAKFCSECGHAMGAAVR